MARLRRWVASIAANKRLVVTLELLALGVFLGALSWALRDVWADAAPLLRHADPVDIGLALAALAAYYLVFILGWMRILVSYGIRIPYRIALQAEMLSMLAKYIPGGVWTPAARVVALRRFGYRDTSLILASVLLEAGLSALAGVGVFVVGLAFVDGVDAPLPLIVAFGVVVAVLLYPPVFRAVATRLLRPFGAHEVPGCRRARLSPSSGSTPVRGHSAGWRSSSSCVRWEAIHRSRRSRTSAVPPRSERSSPSSRSSLRPGSGFGRPRSTASCSRS